MSWYEYWGLLVPVVKELRCTEILFQDLFAVCSYIIAMYHFFFPAYIDFDGLWQDIAKNAGFALELPQSQLSSQG